MKFKEYIKDGLVTIGLVSVVYGGPQLAEKYIPTQHTQRVEYQPMYPSARNKSEVEIDLGASLVDEDGDGSPDRKTRVLAGNHGLHRWNLPITERDKKLFKDLTSRL
mgnify:CR=1 FL=1